MNDNEKKALIGLGLCGAAYVGVMGLFVRDIRKSNRKTAYLKANGERYERTRNELARRHMMGEITLTEYIEAMQTENAFMRIVIDNPMY